MENQTITQIDSVAICGEKNRRSAKRPPPKNMQKPAKQCFTAAERGSYEECDSSDDGCLLEPTYTTTAKVELVSIDDDDVTAADVELITYINENTTVNMANRCLEDAAVIDESAQGVMSTSAPEYHGWFTQSEICHIRAIKNRWAQKKALEITASSGDDFDDLMCEI